MVNISILLTKHIQKTFFCAAIFLSSVVSIFASQDLADYYGYSTPKEKKAIELILKLDFLVGRRGHF